MKANNINGSNKPSHSSRPAGPDIVNIMIDKDSNDNGGDMNTCSITAHYIITFGNWDAFTAWKSGDKKSGLSPFPKEWIW